MSLARSAWKFVYSTSPIILTGGIADKIPGGALPIAALIDIPTELVSGGGAATFEPVPGSSLISNKIGEYPFFNAATAGNAIVNDSVFVSMRMVFPAFGAFGMATKPLAISGLVNSLSDHAQLGGLYSVLLPWHHYRNCCLLDFTCVDDGDSKQAGYIFQLDFKKILITTDDTEGAYNSMIKKIDGKMSFGGDGVPSWQQAAKDLLS